MSSEPEPSSNVHALNLRQRLAVWIVSLLIRGLGRTLRFRMDEATHATLLRHDTPIILILWHNRILFTGEMRRRFRCSRPVSAMVSASRDGAWLTGLFNCLGVHAVRGSSSRRSLAAAREMISEVKAGRDTAITPDGPRGPLYHFNEGATMLALVSGAPVMIMMPNPRKAWRINTWDGLYVPKPFSRVDMAARRIESKDLPRDRAACTQFLRDALMAAVEDLPAPPRCRQSAARAAETAAETAES